MCSGHTYNKNKTMKIPFQGLITKMKMFPLYGVYYYLQLMLLTTCLYFVVSKVLSDISDPSDLQQPSDHPPPFTTMTVHQEMTHPNRSHDQSGVRSHDQSGVRSQPQSHDQSGVRSHDQSGVRSHDQSTVRSHDQSTVRSQPQSHDESIQSHDQSGVRSHDVDPEKVRLESQLDGWCLDLKRNIMVLDVIETVVFRWP